MKNESTMDRWLRLVVGMVFLYIGFISSGFLMWFGYGVGVILIITAGTGFCLFYKIFGFSTNKK